MQRPREGQPLLVQPAPACSESCKAAFLVGGEQQAPLKPPGTSEAASRTLSARLVRLLGSNYPLVLCDSDRYSLAALSWLRTSQWAGGFKAAGGGRSPLQGPKPSRSG
jgi:hypothetical protein